LQAAQLALNEVYAAVREHLSLRERQTLWAINHVRLARETAVDADWEAWEERAS
jgi:hypothetical protein